MSGGRMSAVAAGGLAGRVASDAPWRAWLRPLAAAAGSLLLVLAGVIPVWGTTLLAPQYPKGLSLWFFGGRAEGPVREVNGLNHYIGMRPIDLTLVPELGLWPLAVVGSAAVFLAAILVRGRLGRLALLAMALGPVIILADIQRWLLIFGSELDPSSALRLEPFVPLVVGPSTVWNFTVWTYPGPALVVMWLVALLALVVRRFAPETDRRTALAAAAAGLAIAMLGTILVVIPAVDRDASPGPAAANDAMPAGTVDIATLLAHAADDATVVIPAGRYVGHVEIVRPVVLVADGTVVLDGGGRGTVVTIRSDDVTIRGFTVVNTGGQVEEAAAIKTEGASRISIEDNRIERFFSGIWVNGGRSVRVVGNELIGSVQVAQGADHATDGAAATGDLHAGHGLGSGPDGQGDAITIWTTTGTLVRGNRIHAVRDAVYLNYVDEVLVDANVVEFSRYGVHAMFGTGLTVFGNTMRDNLSGLVFMYSSGVLAGRNVLLDARSAGTGYGVVLKDVSGVRLSENVVAGNRVGLQAEGTVHRLDADALVVRNRIAANDVGVALMASADIAFAANDFDANLTQVLALEPGVDRKNLWDYGATGNRWSDYAGYDLGVDGVGDVPYRSGGAASVIVATAPALGAYRASPAFAVVEAAQSLWQVAGAAVVVDPAPRIEPPVDLAMAIEAARGYHATSDPPTSGNVPGPRSPVDAWTALGFALMGLAAGLALVGRGRLTLPRPGGGNLRELS